MKRSTLGASLIAVTVAASMHVIVSAQRPVAGPNVNVMGGPVKWEDPTRPFASPLKQGDPFGQRQDEISCAVDTRNPLVITCAFNDYTPVELPGLLNDAEIGDAWIGRAWSSDGGQTWANDLLPGYKNDPHGTTSSLWGHDAAADPVWRAAPFLGRSYLAGIAFNRTPSAPGTAGAEFNGVLFVHAYVNNNNIENDPRPVKPDPSINNGQPVILATPAEGFHDKPWLGVDSLGGVHVVVATFNQNRSASAIWYFVSRDGGKTYSKVKLSNAGQKINNGAMVTIHPWTGWVDVSWRRRASPGQTDAIIFVRSTDGGHSFTSPTVLMSLPDLQRADGTLVSRPFDQGSGQYFFRNISNPAMTTDDKGRVYVAWAERANLVPRDSQIKLMIGNPAGADGRVVWTAPSPIDSLITPATPATRGHQLRPSMWFAFGKLTLTYMHTREDDLASVFTRQDLPDPGNPAGKIATYTETQEPKGDLAAGHPEKIFNDFIFDIANTAPANVDIAPVFNGLLLRRHTEDVIALMGTPSPLGSTAFPTFAKTKVSRYGVAFRNGRLEQVQFNVLTRALHCGGNCAFAGDYDDVVAQAYVPNILGIGALPNTLPSIAPKFFVAWTDNRDVRPLAAPTRFSRVGPTCSDADATGTRNQNPYLAPVGYGLYLQSFGNQKPLNTRFARAFTIQFQNAVNATKHYRATIANQPLFGSASWLQFSQRTTLDLSIPPFTTASRALFAKSPDSGGAILVNVVEINQPGGTPVSGGLQSSIILNPDRFTPALAPPVQDPTNPIDPTDPSVGEVYTPDATSPDATSANVLVTPDATSLPAPSPDATSPDATSPDATSVPAAFPDATSPDATSPDATSVPSMTPDATSPDATSIGPSDALTDTLFGFINRSNVAATASIQTFTTKPLCAGCTLQVLVMRPSLSPTQRGCDPKNQDTSVLVANIASPTLVTDPNQLGFDATNASPKNLTVAAPPGGRLTVIYRLRDPNAGSNLTFTDAFGRRHSINPTFNPAGDLVPVLTPAALNTSIAQTCGANCPKPTPVLPLSITTAALPDGVLSQTYNGESGLQMMATGGVGADSWTASGLPAGMGISQTGRISGTPSSAGTFLVTFTVTDSAATPHTASRSLSLRILAPDLIVDSLTHSPLAPTTLDLMTFTAVVKNVGNSTAAASTLLFKIGVETPGAEGTLFAVPALAPGATFTKQRQLTLAVPQNYQNTAMADYFGVVTESNEENNSAIDTYTVSAVGPQTFVVTNTNDSGTGSLRQAIASANASPAADAIVFNIPGPGPYSIAPQSALPTITDPVTIDGTTQPGFSGVPIIELNGTSAGPTSSGLHISAGNSTVRGLIINRFASNGLLMDTNGGNSIERNYIGTDASGTLAQANGGNGVQIIDTASNTLGGSAAARNVISGNTGEGVRIDGAFASGNVIQRNYIGTNASGSGAVGNNASGVYLRRAPGNSVDRNVVSGNIGFAGIAICGNNVFCGGGDFGNQTSNAFGNIIRNNLVGTTADGQSALGNAGYGVSIDGAPNTLVGDASGELGNRISYNGSESLPGVIVFSAGAVGNAILGNSIYANGALGIDLNGDGVTFNDYGDGQCCPPDTDIGPNNLQNFPVISLATTTQINGSLDSTPDTTFTIQLFTSPTCDMSGYGQGQSLITTLSVTTDPILGRANFSQTGLSLIAGRQVTATATDANGNTSEFSQCAGVVVP